MREVNFGAVGLPSGWKVFRSDNGLYRGEHNSSTPFSKTKWFEDRYECRRSLNGYGKDISTYLKALDARFKAAFLPILTCQLMAFYSSDIEFYNGFKHIDKKHQSNLKKSVNNYYSVTESECKRLGCLDMVDFLYDKFNDDIFPLTESILSLLKSKFVSEENCDLISKCALVGLLGQTIRERNLIFKMNVEKSLDTAIYCSEKLMMSLFKGNYDVNLNETGIVTEVNKLIASMSAFKLSDHIKEYESGCN